MFTTLVLVILYNSIFIYIINFESMESGMGSFVMACIAVLNVLIGFCFGQRFND